MMWVAGLGGAPGAISSMLMWEMDFISARGKSPIVCMPHPPSQSTRHLTDEIEKLSSTRGSTQHE